MNTSRFPNFETKLAGLHQFILYLAKEYHSGNINVWDHVDELVKNFFTSERMDEIESVAPGWKKMASYSEGITLTHVMCVFLGLFIMPEYQALTPEQQQLAKWIVLFHDIEKIHVGGKRDGTHPFRSAVNAANALRGIGFASTASFNDTIDLWSGITISAVTDRPNSAGEQICDNKKLPEIIAGIEAMYGKDTPAALIIKGVLFHMCVQAVADWPQPSPLTENELKTYINRKLLALLKVMHLADNDGWTLFDPERELYRNETLTTFKRVEKLIT
jgi:hypothetical protein